MLSSVPVFNLKRPVVSMLMGLSLAMIVTAFCPACPSCIDDKYLLKNQTNGNCFYTHHVYRKREVVLECDYWLTGELERSIPAAKIALCPSSVNVTEDACKYYTIGGVHD